MYRIKQDKRILKSAELITGGLTQCLKTTSFEKINVCDIAVSAGISRATFYRIFDTPSDVIAYMCDKLADDTIRSFSKASGAGNGLFGVNALKHWCSQTDVIETIFKSGRSSIIQKSFEKYSENLIRSASGLSEKEIDYLRTTTIGIICSILRVWTRHGRQESPEELMEIYRKIGKFVTKMRFDQAQQEQ